MDRWIVLAGIALVVFSLAILIRRDWLRLTFPSRQVIAEVIDHHQSRDPDSHRLNYAAIYRFDDETGDHQVTDAVCSLKPEPSLGTLVELTYPDGHPDLARKSRPLTWVMVYLALVAMLSVLVGKLLGWLP